MQNIKLSEEFKNQMIQLQLNHLSQNNLEIRQDAIDHLIEKLFGPKISGNRKMVYITQESIISCTLVGGCHLQYNAILEMFKEQISM